MFRRRLSERVIIIYSAGLIVLSGLMLFFSYSLGRFFFYFIFSTYLLYRLVSIIATRKLGWTASRGYRFAVFLVMLVTIILNIVGWQEADFFLLFLLMIDYLLVLNRNR